MPQEMDLLVSAVFVPVSGVSVFDGGTGLETVPATWAAT